MIKNSSFANNYHEEALKIEMTYEEADDVKKEFLMLKSNFMTEKDINEPILNQKSNIRGLHPIFMKYQRDGRTIYFRLDKYEEIIDSILKICKQEDIRTGTIIGIGAINQVTLRFLKQDEKEFLEKQFNEDMEVTAFIGNISMKQEEPYLHCHITLARHTFESVAGHCHQAIVGATFEGKIEIDTISVDRKYSDKIGLNLYDFE